MHAPAPSAKRPSHPLLAAQAAAAERIPGLRALLDKAASRLAEPSSLMAGGGAAAALAEIKAQTLSDLLDGLPAGGGGGGGLVERGEAPPLPGPRSPPGVWGPRAGRP